MSAGISHELDRLIHRFGGVAIGAFIQPVAGKLAPSPTQAILLDQSHDKSSPVEKRSIYTTILLPSASPITMSACSTGINRGYVI